MVKLVALYRKPTDPEAFDRHYRDVHMPLVRKMPGLQRVEVSRITGGPTGPSDHYLLAEMYFADEAAMKAALASPEGRASGKDLMGFAQGIFTLMFARVDD